MKIRIFDDSIRLRLDRQEVNTIATNQRVVCQTRFPSGDVFQYELMVANTDVVTASFEGNCISICLPIATANEWATTEQDISVSATSPLEDGALSLLIEKDFECLDPRDGEDQSNRFKNPKANMSN